MGSGSSCLETKAVKLAVEKAGQRASTLSLSMTHLHLCITQSPKQKKEIE